VSAPIAPVLVEQSNLSSTNQDTLSWWWIIIASVIGGGMFAANKMYAIKP